MPLLPRILVFCVSACVLAAYGGAQQDPAAEHAAPQAQHAAPPWTLSGNLTARWIGRGSGGEEDFDLRGYADIMAGDPDAHGVTLHASGQGFWDLNRDRSQPNRFSSIEDTYNGDLVGYLYTAHLDFHGGDRPGAEWMPDGIARVRLGRQIMTETAAVLFFDGVSVQSVPVASLGDLVLEGWVGLPNHIFESSARGDFTAGGAATLTPWRDARLRLDYMHATDRYLGSTSEDDAIGVRLDQRLAPSLSADVRLNVLEFEARDFSAGAAWSWAEQEFTARVRYTALWSDQSRRSIEFDTFTPLLQTYYAFDQYDVSLSKGLGDHLYADGGLQWRQLREDSNEGVFNHEFARYWIAPGVAEWPWTGLDVSVTFELWDSGDDSFTAFGADLTQDFDARWRASIGTLFELFRYDILLEQEREDVQVSYGKLRFRATDQLDLSASFEFEDGDTYDFITGILSARIDF